MAEGSKKSAGSGGGRWSESWHLPVLLLGLALFVLGVYSMMPANKGPQYDARLKSAAEYLEAHNLKGAEKVLKGLGSDIAKASKPQRGRYWEYWADLNYDQEKMQNPTQVQTKVSKANNRKIIKYYDRAQTLMGPLRTQSLERKARTLASLGRDDEALKVVDELKDAAARQRYMIVRDLIDRQCQQPGLALKQIEPLISRFKQEVAAEKNAKRAKRQRIWIAQVQAKMLLKDGDPNGAVTFLLHHIPRLSPKASAAELAPLYVLLARAYQQMGQFDDARQFYHYAQKSLPPSSGLNATILVGLGKMTLAANTGANREQKALQYFSQVTQNYPSQQPADLDAFIGESDVNLRLGQDDTAMRLVHQAVAKLKAAAPRWASRKQELIDVAQSHIDHANDAGHYDLALKLLQAMVPLQGKPLPAKFLLDFAKTHQNIAQQRLKEANPPTASANSQPIAIQSSASTQPSALRKLLNQQAAEHFGSAAQYFLKYAHAVTITNDQAYGMALWQAGVDFDKAQQWRKAINVYSTYIKTRPNDPRKLKAINHLGEAFLADGQYHAAIARFKQLIDNFPNSPQAFASLVPLAQAYIAIGKNGPAKRTLLQVVSDHPSIRPSSDTYRDALIALGKLYYQLGNKNGSYYVKAIERLSEAVQRYGDTRQGPILRFLLADSYRKSIPSLDKMIKQQQSQSDRLRIKQERDRRLREAEKYYNQTINELAACKPESLMPLEKLYYRNAYFYQADCAYDRGDYRSAIRLYSEANRKWQKDPVSLVALVQIVNAYCALGEYRNAKAINEQALWQLQRMPDSAFDKPGMPMTRENWKDWLMWSDKLKLFGNGAKAQQASGP